MNSSIQRRVQRDELSVAQAENAQLKATIIALREELEQMRIDKEFGVQQAVAANSDEVAQLRATIASLREGLEARDAEHLQKVQDIERAARDEARQLQETIRLLRDQLEGSRAGNEG